jgi:hypothetical protein
MGYVVKGLDPAPFQPLFGLPSEDLAARGIVRMTVTEKPGFPCRVSLTDRDVGETVLLMNHVSHEAANPYRASHAIFVAEAPAEAAEYVDEVPPVFAGRVLSLRAFDRDGMMVDAVLARPGEADRGIRALLADPAVETIHAHNAVRGCFAALIRRHG